MRKNGAIMLHSLSKVDAVFTCGAPDMKIALHGQPVARTSLRAVTKPQSVNVNGQQIDPVYNAENKIITIRSTTPR